MMKISSDGSNSLFERSRDEAAFGTIVLATRDDDVGPVRERASDRLVSLAAHDDGMAGRQRLEPAQVFGDVPDQRVAVADHAVAGYGDDNRDHTATGALMEG